ncbi:hypothetical protein ES703_83969 [subsurface metagenome]
MKEDAKWIGELVGTFRDPIIVSSGGWGDSLPEWLKTSITLERLVMNMRVNKGELPTGTDAEACAYLNTASFEAPFSHDWTQIYLYIATKVYEKWRTKESGVTMPDDIRVEELNRNQMDDLNRLKAWIYRKRVAARLDRERGVRREEKKEETIRREKKEEEAATLQQKFDLGI